MKGKLVLTIILGTELKAPEYSFHTWIRRVVTRLLAVVLWVWSCGALCHVVGIAWPVTGILFVFVPWAWTRGGKLRKSAALCVLLVMPLAFFSYAFTKPRADRQWQMHCARDPEVRVLDGGERVEINNVRQFRWEKDGEFEPSWKPESYNIKELNKLDLVVEPLSGSEYFAHTMLSFAFSAGRRVVISIEVRKEQGESYGIIPGFYRQFELFYQINSERDAFTLRAIQPDSSLYVFPVKASAEFIQRLFLEMVREADRLHDRPGFYHSLRANCTTKLFDHVNMEIDAPMGYRREVLLPAKAGKFLHEMGWMDTSLAYPEARQRFRLADKVRKFADDPDFSIKIRQ